MPHDTLDHLETRRLIGPENEQNETLMEGEHPAQALTSMHPWG